MIASFADRATEDIFDGTNSPRARKCLPRELWRTAARKLDQLDSATELSDLRVPPENRLEALTADRAGQHSIRINDQYRVCFIWKETGPERVEIADYH